MWERNGLHKHRPPRVDVINKVVLLVALVTIHREVHIWCFTFEHVSEQQWLTKHVDGIVWPCHPKKICQIHKSYEETASSMMVWYPILLLTNYSLHPVEQFFHLHCKQSILHIIQENLLPPVGDRYPPGPLEGKKASREALSLLFRKAIPSWARRGLLAEWADMGKKQIQARATRQTRALSIASVRLSRVQRPWISEQIKDKSARL